MNATGKAEGGGQVEVDLPTERPLVFYLSVTDDRGALVSTEHVELR